MNVLRRLSAIPLTVLWLLCGLLTAQAPAAQRYVVMGCHTGSGASIGVEGWIPSISGTGANTYNLCGSRGFFGASVDRAAVSSGASGSWTFEAPDGTRISDYSLYRFAASNGGSGWAKGYGIYHDASWPDPNHAADSCFASRGCVTRGVSSSWYAPQNHVLRTGLRLDRLILAAQCSSSVGSCASKASYQAGQFAVYMSRVGLADRREPAFSSDPRGPLFSDATRVQGVTETGWSAVDGGGGLKSVGLLIDGTTVSTRAAAPNDPDCAPLSSSSVPCPLSASGVVEYDTARLPDGAHRAQLAITDIAGNRTYSRAVRITTANHPVPNGLTPTRTARLTARFARAGRSLTVGFNRTRRISGRLTKADGTPVPWAAVRVYARQERAGAKTRLVKTVATDTAGRFSYTPPRGPSRRFTLAYRAYSTDQRDAARTTVALGVRAAVRLRLTPRTLRNGSRMLIRGSLPGRVARTGTLVTMQVLNPRKVAFMTLRVDRRGRFRGAYRFRNTHVRYTFRFRAVVPKQAAYPYRLGRSRTVAVTVLP